MIRINRFILSALLLPALLLLYAGDALAHKVMVFAWIDGDTVYTESKFSGGKKVRGGQITVTDPDGNLLLKGKTDDQGEFAFKIPRKTGMKIELMAGEGHRGEWTVQPDEIDTVADTEALPVPPVSVASPTAPSVESPRQETSNLNAADVQTIIETALDKKMRPVLRMLAESQDDGPSVSDIFGGIGYILGLMGVAAHFHYRRKIAELSR
ncbi:hypothetical protein [Desulfonema ishimotonii]|nr:hypothetical protein [Desulfonema ishimotonii]